MPPSWPSRLLSASTASSQNQSATSPSQQLNKPLPANPPASHLSPNRNPSLPVRTSSSASPQHTHNRSASHPLPRIFSKKKSTQNFGGIGDLNAQVDDTLVPVLDEAQFTSSPTRASSGKRRFEDDPNAARHCMCCHSRVRFPKELKVFRCTTCLTINDLEPVLSNKENERTGQGERESRSAHLLGPKRKSHALGNLFPVLICSSGITLVNRTNPGHYRQVCLGTLDRQMQERRRPGIEATRSS